MYMKEIPRSLSLLYSLTRPRSKMVDNDAVCFCISTSCLFSNRRRSLGPLRSTLGACFSGGHRTSCVLICPSSARLTFITRIRPSGWFASVITRALQYRHAVAQSRKNTLLARGLIRGHPLAGSRIEGVPGLRFLSLPQEY